MPWSMGLGGDQPLLFGSWDWAGRQVESRDQVVLDRSRDTSGLGQDRVRARIGQDE